MHVSTVALVRDYRALQSEEDDEEDDEEEEDCSR